MPNSRKVRIERDTRVHYLCGCGVRAFASTDRAQVIVAKLQKKYPKRKFMVISCDKNTRHVAVFHVVRAKDSASGNGARQ